MAETLTELVAKIETDAAGLKSGLSDAEKQTEASSKKMQDSLKKVGMAMAASGAAITTALGLMGKAAIDEDINMKRLATTINNSGTAYDSVKDSMEALIATTQRKTGVADDEQRNILNRLILVTNDYRKAMELLPTVLDLAAAGEMDATTAATYLGKAYLELEDGAKEVSVRFGQASLQFKNMEDIQNRVAGSAENLANPLSVLKASMGDVAETIGANLIPLIKGLTDKIVDIAEKVQGWIKEHPELAKQITLVAGALGIFLGVVGTALLLVPKLKAAWISMQLVFTASPWGAIIAGIGLLIAAGILLWQNWDKVTMFFKEAWINIKQFFLEGIKNILDSLSNFTRFIPGLNSLVDSAKEKIANMIEATKLEEDALRTEKALRDVGEALEETTEIIEENTDATKEQTEAAKDNIDTLKKQQDELLSTTDKLRNMRREYEYTRSDAGRLNISVKDVTFALFDMGKTTDEVATVLAGLGDEQDNVNAIMKAFNLTAQEVNDILNQQKDSIDGVTNSLGELSAQQAKLGYTKGILESGMSEFQSAVATGILPSTINGQATAGMSPSQIAELSGVELTPELRNLWTFDKGGVVPGYIGQPQLATVHGGETIIPANESMGNVVVNFTQPVFFDREDQMNQLVDKIRKGIQRQDRLRFGGAYSG